MTRPSISVMRRAVARVSACAVVLGLAGTAAVAQVLPGGDLADVTAQAAKAPPTQAGRAPKPATPAPKPAPPKPTGPAFSVRAFGEAGYTWFSAHESFDAVLGSAGGAVFGGGVTVSHRSGYFGRVGIEYFGADGERVYVFGGEVFPMGIPLSVSITPIDITGGYRFVAKPKPTRPPARPPAKPAFQPARPLPTDAPKTTPAPPAAARPAPARPVRRWVPYVGGGIGFLSYKETSDFPGGSEDVSDTFTSYHVLGGMDFPVSKWIGVGAEAIWRFVPDGLKDSPVGEEFGEKDLGGLAIRVLVTVGR
jgi:hypothetical protein